MPNSKVLQAPKQITMENPIVVHSTDISTNNAQISDDTSESVDPDPRCIFCLYICFFIPGCIAACADCAH